MIRPLRVTDILKICLCVRRFHLRLVSFMPFGHVSAAPPALNLAPMPPKGRGLKYRTDSLGGECDLTKVAVGHTAFGVEASAVMLQQS